MPPSAKVGTAIFLAVVLIVAAFFGARGKGLTESLNAGAIVAGIAFLFVILFVSLRTLYRFFFRQDDRNE
jgi:hypothetical protein